MSLCPREQASYGLVRKRPSVLPLHHMRPRSHDGTRTRTSEISWSGNKESNFGLRLPTPVDCHYQIP